MRVLSIVAVAVVLLFAASAATARSAYVPTSRAIAHWKRIALQPSHLDPFLQGYFSGAAGMRKCRLVSGATVFYSCKVVDIGGFTIGFGYLSRYGRCNYLYLVGTADGRHKVTRRFSFCG